MAYAADQIEKHTLVLRLSISIYKMSDDEIRRLLATLERPHRADQESGNKPETCSTEGQHTVFERHLMIARLFVVIKKLDKNALLERLSRYNHPDFKWVREFPRMNCYLLVDFSADGKAYRGYIRDISAGGVFIETSEHFEHNQQVALCFTLSESGENLPLKIKGHVRGVYADGIGVHYDPITDQQRDIIDTLIRKNH